MDDIIGTSKFSSAPVDNDVDEKVEEVGEVAVAAKEVAVVAKGETGSVPVGASNHRLVPDEV
jgi:hypothetical protein